MAALAKAPHSGDAPSPGIVLSPGKKYGFAAIRVVIAALLLVLQVYPVFYIVTSSMKTAEEFGTLAPYQLPGSVNFNNYINVLTNSAILTYFKNSLIIVVAVLAVLLTFSSMAGFALSKINFKGKKFLLTFFLLGLMLPMQVALIPLFTIFSKLNLLNTYAAIILPQIAFSLSYSIQLFYSFNKFLPNDVIEAAIIDGCSPMGTFVKIVCPMSKNSILTVATMQGVFCWNDFINAYTFTRSTTMKTVPLGLNDFVGMYGLTDWGSTFAMIVLTVLPTFVFYFFTSKYMLGGLTSGAVKG